MAMEEWTIMLFKSKVDQKVLVIITSVFISCTKYLIKENQIHKKELKLLKH